jgi:site-specific recombinase XerD
LEGSAQLELVDGVSHLRPEQAVFEGMLAGWARQQRSRFLKEVTITRRLFLVRRMVDFSGQFPWEWTPAEAEAFITEGAAHGRRPAMSTIRSNETQLRLFMEFVTDGRYGWARACDERFGTAPQQIFHEWNSVVHRSDFEGRPGRRPLSYDEVQALFDAADGRAAQIRKRRRKGALAAMRDAALLKTVYAFGLRRRESWGLDLVDLRHKPKIESFGRFGALFVRWGKASRGSPPKRRTVLTVPEMDWIVDVLEQWVSELRPLFGAGANPALWVNERHDRVSLRSINDAFEAARLAAELPEELDLHCLRHSYVTHLLEFDYPERFVQDQVGHVYASTLVVYAGVGDEYRNRLLRRSLDRHPELWRAGQ